PARHRVLRGGREIRLSPTEFRLLEFLMRRAGGVIRRGTIIEAVWDRDQGIEDNTLDAFVRLLRTKVDRNFHPKLIHTVRGVGYTVRDEREQ
ncbi:MAG TPA: winged helix-turn-helix domain-containing protein, partial [Terriglobia bacterium]|nr:winged helix-turn-helix domain-containing protein [Terriglobia bacterium]